MATSKKILSTGLAFLLGMVLCLAQEKKTKADVYFFQYEYQKAIVAYESDLAQGTLTEQQFLNLADSYYKTNNFEKASNAYIELYKKEDNFMNNLHLNRMLHSISKSTNREEKDAFLATMSSSFPREFLENVDFNTKVLEGEDKGDFMDSPLFNLEGNSPQSDFSPAFYGDNLLFSSGRLLNKKKKYVPSGEGYLNIYGSKLSEDGQISTVNPFSEITESDYHKATPYFSETLRSVFYVLSNTEDGELLFDENGKNALAIGMQPKNGPFRLLLKDLSTSFYYPFYDEGNGKLYFAADFEEGFGGTDIYYVHTNNGLIMSAPINLGPRINSPGNEIAPYIFENSFYFSSDVFYGLGGMDIYKAEMEGDGFSIPVNLGRGINSPEDDFGLIIRNEGDGLLGYFASNRPGGKGNDDLYGFRVAEKPGIRTLTLKGRVVKSYDNSDYVAGAAVRLLDVDGALLAEGYTNYRGDYRLEIPWQSEILLESSKERFSTHRKRLDETELEALQNEAYNIQIAKYDDLVEEKEGQTVVKLNKFFFRTSSSRLTPEIETELDKVVSFVKDFPSVQLRIETYTDSRGGSSTNFRITKNRSDAIKQYLIQKGVPSSAILYSVGYGEDKILNNCTNGVYCLEVLHRQNQRSLVVVLNDNVLFN